MVEPRKQPGFEPALRLCVCLALLLAGVAAQAAEVLARLDRTQVVEGETVTLVLQTDDPSQSLEADFSVLENDFLLLDRRSETQMSIVNGKQTAVVRLLLTLEPRRNGDLQVPALQFPGARTEPLLLNVEPAPELAPGDMPPVFIELALEPEDGPFYVHSQMSLTVKIFYQQNLTEATINPPAPEQASVRLLDEVPFPAERNGTRYRVLQRRYAIFPERSGTLVIPPMRLTGRLIERSSERLWQPSVRGRRVSQESESLTIEVLPRPEDFQGAYWLPARQLTLSQQVSDIDALRVGEPVTRTVIIDAVGLEEHMLEEPVWPALSDARIYPDQPQGISRDDGQWVRGHKEFRYAIVPETAGELLLPEIQLDWWDTTSDQARTAVLPELRVAVAPSELTPSASRLPGGVSAVGQFAELDTAAGDASAWRMAAFVFAGLWLATLVWSWRRPPGQRRAASPQRDEPAGTEKELLRRLKQACQECNAGRARTLMRSWLRDHGPPQARGSIVEFAAGLDDPGLRAALQAFNASGYQEGASPDWDGREFWRAFRTWRGRYAETTRPGQDQGPDLYAAAR
jgi:hypothetical protein